MRAFLFFITTLVFFSLNVTNQAYAEEDGKFAALVIDADTGVVLMQENANRSRYPASLTKMMTAYLVFQALDNKKLRMDSKITVSSRASRQAPSKMGLRRGERVELRDMLLATIVKSANDAAVVLAEAVAGSEWQFATLMNRTASRLGMTHTNFTNASGLHDRRQKTTAYDLARLAVALKRDFPHYYYLFKRDKFYFRGNTYYSHNRVTMNYRGADGLKTGYVNASGFNLVTSAERNGHRIVGVVMGGRTAKRRDRFMTTLLDKSFYQVSKGNFENKEDVRDAKALPVPELKPSKMADINDNEPDDSELSSNENEEPEVQSSNKSEPNVDVKANLTVSAPAPSISVRNQEEGVASEGFVPIPELKPSKESLSHDDMYYEDLEQMEFQSINSLDEKYTSLLKNKFKGGVAKN